MRFVTDAQPQLNPSKLNHAFDHVSSAKTNPHAQTYAMAESIVRTMKALVDARNGRHEVSFLDDTTRSCMPAHSLSTYMRKHACILRTYAAHAAPHPEEQ